MNILIFALGVVLGAFIVYIFNPKDVTVNGKARAKKGGIIDFTSNVNESKNKKVKLLDKLKNRRNRK